MTDIIQQRINRFIHYGTTLPCAEVQFRDDWGTFYFSVFGKQFALMPKIKNETTFITLKNMPNMNEELRVSYPQSIVPGYYTNKTHWNSIILTDETITDEMIESLILTSYQLVCQKLTKAQREQIASN